MQSELERSDPFSPFRCGSKKRKLTRVNLTLREPAFDQLRRGVYIVHIGRFAAGQSTSSGTHLSGYSSPNATILPKRVSAASDTILLFPYSNPKNSGYQERHTLSRLLLDRARLVVPSHRRCHRTTSPRMGAYTNSRLALVGLTEFQGTEVRGKLRASLRGSPRPR
jgi:hypothetical protein